MGMIAEFKEFVSKGNVVDLAVGVVIGAAFGKIVSSLVDGIIMPFIGVLTGGKNVTDWKYVISPSVIENGKEVLAENAIRYGEFIQSIINFLLIAFVIFMFLKAYNRMRAPAAEEPTAEDVLLLREIRDSLKR